jgi:hypothetical protein
VVVGIVLLLAAGLAIASLGRGRQLHHPLIGRHALYRHVFRRNGVTGGQFNHESGCLAVELSGADFLHSPPHGLLGATAAQASTGQIDDDAGGVKQHLAVGCTPTSVTTINWLVWGANRHDCTVAAWAGKVITMELRLLSAPANNQRDSISNDLTMSQPTV